MCGNLSNPLISWSAQTVAFNKVTGKKSNKIKSQFWLGARKTGKRVTRKKVTEKGDDIGWERKSGNQTKY